MLFKPDSHFRTRYPLSLVQQGKGNSDEAPKPEYVFSLLGASIRGDVMDLQMNRIIMYTWDTANRRVTLSLSSESGLEQLCQFLSAMNAYGAILDNRTGALEVFASKSRQKTDSNDVKRILDTFRTRELEDEDDEDDRLNSTSNRLIESDSFKQTKKPPGEWFQVDDILPSYRISQLETKIDAEFRSLQFRKQYLTAAIVDTSNSLNTSSAIEPFDTAVEPALSDIYNLIKDDDEVMVESLRSHHNLHGRIAVFVRSIL